MERLTWRLIFALAWRQDGELSCAPMTQAIIETLDTIEAWSQATFGPSPNILVALSRANAELSELIMVACQPDPNPDILAVEAADVTICMCRPAAIVGVPIHDIFNAATISDVPIPAPARRASNFGPRSPLAAALVANGHMSVLMARCRTKEFTRKEAGIYVELIVSRMFEICLTLHLHLGTGVSTKMAINRARKWRQSG